jgi:hypothetical protein
MAAGKSSGTRTAGRKTTGSGTGAGRTTTARKTTSAPKAAARTPSPPARQAGELVTGAVDLAVSGIGTARRVLDSRGGLPAYAGAGALAVVGAIEWPVAMGVGAGYAALRRWGGRLPEPLRSLTGSR